MSCLSISQGVTECSMYPVLRIAKLVLLIGCCLSFRPDDGEQELPKGFTFHAEGMLDKNGLEIDRLLLQRKHAAEDDRSHQQQNHMPNFTQELAGTATHLHITSPSALQQLGEEAVGPSNEEPKFCDATESTQWKCMDGDNPVDKVQEKKYCQVKCIDNYNFKPKKEKTKCQVKDGKANFNPVPECLELEHCLNSGDGGWTCEDSYLTGNAKAPIPGTICTPKCGDGFKVNVEVAHCQKGGKYDTEPKCVELGECPARGDNWACEEGGEEQVKHGKSCKVKCNDEKMVPVFEMVECNGEEIVDKRGTYKQGAPKCLSEKDAKEERAKAEAAMAEKDAKKTTGGKPAGGGGGTTPSALPRYTTLIVVLVGMSNWLCLGSAFS